MHHRIPFILALHSSVRRFETPFEGLSFVKMLVNFGIIYATDPLVQNMTKMFVSVDSPSIFLAINPCRPC